MPSVGMTSMFEYSRGKVRCISRIMFPSPIEQAPGQI
jgi:hypothetical protein